MAIILQDATKHRLERLSISQPRWHTPNKCQIHTDCMHIFICVHDRNKQKKKMANCYQKKIVFFILFWSYFIFTFSADLSKEKGNESVDGLNCPSLKMGNFPPETPQQVHLSLTNKMDEMNISWVTFEEVTTFVEYWREGAKKNKVRKIAEMTKHQFRDFLKDVSGCNSEQKIVGNFRYMHTVTLEGLKDDTTYEYRLGHCEPNDEADNEQECLSVIRQEHILQTNGAQEIQRDKVFFFKTFPRHSAKRPFTIAIFGDMGLKRPEEQGVFEDEEASMWKHANKILTLPDTLAPHAMESLMSLVHPGHNDSHPVRKSHLNERSSGLRMTNVQLVLHIGDIAYDMQEYRMKQKVRNEDEEEMYNLGDRFMQVVEDIAAYVPYMVVAGNHENEEKTARYHNGEREKGSFEYYEPQYEHYESRFRMPRNFEGHNTSQFYDFTYGPIWFICVSTEYYYSHSIRSPTFRWVPDRDNVKRQYEFVEQSLKKANQNRHKYPWVVALQHRPFYCSSVNKVTCRFNKMHKHGIPSIEDPNKLVYGLEELFNRYSVDLVITGHEHTFELFPPIELVNGRPKVVPEKFGWEVHRHVQHIDEDEDIQTQLDTRHVFKTFTDPMAPVYLIVGRPGNAEEMEKLHPVPWLQRMNFYNRFSFTLLHFPFDVTQTQSTIAIRQVDIENGSVPVEFLLEKTFPNYAPQVLCAELDASESGAESKYHMELSELTRERVQQRRNPFTKRRRAKGRDKKQQQQAKEEVPNTKELIRELLYAMNRMGFNGEKDVDERRRRIMGLKKQICENKNRVKVYHQEEEKEVKVIERKTGERTDKPMERGPKLNEKELIEQIKWTSPINRRTGEWKSAEERDNEESNGILLLKEDKEVKVIEEKIDERAEKEMIKLVQRGQNEKELVDRVERILPINRRTGGWKSAEESGSEESNGSVTGDSAISSMSASSSYSSSDEQSKEDSHGKRMAEEEVTATTLGWTKPSWNR